MHAQVGAVQAQYSKGLRDWDSECKGVISKNSHYVGSLAEVFLLCAQQGLALGGMGTAWMIPAKTLGTLRF